MTNTNLDVAKSFVSGKSLKNKSMSTDGTTIYSYGTAIAKRMKNGEIVVNNTSYSRTTSSKHMPALRSALRDERKVSYTGNKYKKDSYTGYGYNFDDFSDDDFAKDNDSLYKKHLKK